MTDIVRIGGLTIDRHRRTVRVDGQLVTLTVSEYKALTKLAEEPDRCVTHEELIRNHYDVPQEWNDFDLPRTRTVHQALMRVRAKIGKDYIKTVWGVGFRLVDPAEVEAVA